MLFLVKNDPGEKESEMACCHYTTATFFAAKVRGEVFAHFHAVAVKRHRVCGIYCFVCRDEFFVNNPPDVKENDEYALDFALRLSRLFSVSVTSGFRRTAHALFPERLSKHCRGLRLTFFPKFAQNSMLFLCRTRREIASS
jgi:hypothetical protein